MVVWRHPFWLSRFRHLIDHEKAAILVIWQAGQNTKTRDAALGVAS